MEKTELKEFKHRVKKAFIDKDGMIHLGWNKISSSSPFGKELIAKNKHIKKTFNKEGK